MNPIRIAIAGHVDHGKSTLIGKILKESGAIFEDKEKKIEKICSQKGIKFEYAFLLDAFEEEQKQGITIDKLEIPWKYQSHNFVFIDTPGHKEFIKNMISGSSKADIAIVLIDANEGIQEQSQEHLSILNLLGVKQVIILVNKMDLIDYQENVFDNIQTNIKKFLTTLSFSNFNIIPISAYQGENLFDLSDKMSWYHGPTLLETILDFRNNFKDDVSLSQISIQDVYKFDDKRVYVGIVLSGNIRLNDQISFALSHSSSKIKTFEVWNEKKSQPVYKKDDVFALTLSDPLFLVKGDVGYLVSNNIAPTVANNFSGSFFWFGKNPPSESASYSIKIANQKHAIQIKNLKLSGESFYTADFLSEQPMAFNYFEDVSSTGRFVILNDYEIVGCGIISKKLVKLAENEKQSLINRPFIVWLTGLSGAGKTTIAHELKNELEKQHRRVVILDGDQLRSGLNSDLGFDNSSRTEQARRTAEISKILSEQGFAVIVALISPQASARKTAKSLLEQQPFIEVFVDAPLETCIKRDVKGLYKLAKDGKVENFTGLSSEYEVPTNPNLRLDTKNFSLSQNIDSILNYLLSH